MKFINLTQNQCAVIDDDMFDEISKYKWCYLNGYAVRNKSTRDGSPRGKLIHMHRVIAGTPNGKFTDHIDGNKLNNTRDNLRSCTTSQNMANVGIIKSNKSGYRGVSWDKDKGKWASCIRYQGKLIRLGYFANPKDASIIYLKKAIELNGDFVRTI